MVLKPDPSATATSGALAMARRVWRDVLLPVFVVVALLFIAVALIEGPPLEQFLYAVF